MPKKSAMSWVDDLTWQDLQRTMKEGTEQDIKKMLDHEAKNQKRMPFLFRMHGRFNKLRTTRERSELASIASQE